jgi:hypothetical protein
MVSYVRIPELTVAELLDDSLVHLLMASDGVSDAALRGLIETMQQAHRPMSTAVGDTRSWVRERWGGGV